MRALPHWESGSSLGRRLVVNYEQLLVARGQVPSASGPELSSHLACFLPTRSCCSITDLLSQVLIRLCFALSFSDQSQPGSTVSPVPGFMPWCGELCCWELPLPCCPEHFLGQSTAFLLSIKLCFELELGRVLALYCTAFAEWEPQSREKCTPVLV